MHAALGARARCRHVVYSPPAQHGAGDVRARDVRTSRQIHVVQSVRAPSPRQPAPKGYGGDKPNVHGWYRVLAARSAGKFSDYESFWAGDSFFPCKLIFCEGISVVTPSCTFYIGAVHWWDKSVPMNWGARELDLAESGRAESA